MIPQQRLQGWEETGLDFAKCPCPRVSLVLIGSSHHICVAKICAVTHGTAEMLSKIKALRLQTTAENSVREELIPE